MNLNANPAATSVSLEPAESEVAILEKLKTAHEKILKEIRKEIIGQDSVVEQVLTSLLVGGHSIITGVPGLAKTLLIKTIASITDLNFKRIQFTPDLMPADITGTDIIEEDHTTGHRTLVFVKGPIFTNSSWPTKSTARRPRHNRRCWKPCRNTASRFRVPPTS